MPNKTDNEDMREVAHILGVACGCFVLTWVAYLGLCAILAAAVAFAFGIAFIKVFVALVVVSIILNIIAGIVKK